MTGVRITKNVEPKTRKNLGFEAIAQMSFLLGVAYPLPDWYFRLSYVKKKLWLIYCHFGDLLTILLFISNVGGIYIAYHDIRAFVTCIGTIAYIICFRIKLLIYKMRTKNLEHVVESLHKITETLNYNPFQDTGFFAKYHKYYNLVVFLSKGKISSVLASLSVFLMFELVHGALQDSDSKRHLPMFGWFPYNPYELTNYQITCLFQYFAYSSFLLKDVVVDLFFLIILVILNTHLIYLRTMLEFATKAQEDKVGLLFPEDKEKILHWWVKHHQMVLRTVDDFKEITSPYLFWTYISVGIILFFGGVLVTSDVEYDLVQQMIVLAINSSNLVQLYIFSVVGDKITENGLRLTEIGFRSEVINSNHSLGASYLFITTRCSKPILIRFGKITPLCVASFGNIVKATFSYFITTVQMREKLIIQVEN